MVITNPPILQTTPRLCRSTYQFRIAEIRSEAIRCAFLIRTLTLLILGAARYFTRTRRSISCSRLGYSTVSERDCSNTDLTFRRLKAMPRHRKAHYEKEVFS